MAKADEKDEWALKIGARIKRLRRALPSRNKRPVSLAQLGARTHGVLSKSQIGNYEQGTRRPGIEEALVLGRALGVPACSVLCLDEDHHYQTPVQRPAPDYRLPDEWAIVYDMLRPEERQHVISVAKMRLRDRGVDLERVLDSAADRVDRMTDEMPPVGGKDSVYEVPKDSDLHDRLRKVNHGPPDSESAGRGPSSRPPKPKARKR